MTAHAVDEVHTTQIGDGADDQEVHTLAHTGREVASSPHGTHTEPLSARRHTHAPPHTYILYSPVAVVLMYGLRVFTRLRRDLTLT